MQKLSQKFEEKISQIISTQSNNTFLYELSIRSLDNEEIYIAPVIIDSISVEKLFLYNTMDDIRVYGKFRPKDVLKLIDNINSLYATVTIKMYDVDKKAVDLDQPFLVRKYLVHIPDLEDIYKKYNLNQIIVKDKDDPTLVHHESKTIPLVLQLLDENNFKLRKSRINTIFQRVNLKQVLMFACNVFQIPYVDYEDGINPNIFQNLYIPYEYGKFDSIFDYLHVRYGIYQKGFNYYYFDNTIYFYPCFDPLLERKKHPVLHIYKVPKGNYPGLKNYSIMIDDDIHLISNGDLYNLSLSYSELENDGSNHVFFAADRIIDRFKQDTSNGSIILPNVMNLGTDISQRVLKNGVAVKFLDPTMNLYFQSSELAKKSTELVVVGWSSAQLYDFIPGQKIKLYYEKKDGLIFQEGILEGIKFDITRLHNLTSNIPVFTADAVLMLRLQPA